MPRRNRDALTRTEPPAHLPGHQPARVHADRRLARPRLDPLGWTVAQGKPAGLTGSPVGSLSLGGAMAAGNVRPCLGSIVARAKGFRGELPPFMVVGGRLHQGKRAIAGEGGGALGALYDPFRLVYDPEHGTRIPALQLPDNLSPDRLQNRQMLLRSLDQARRSIDTGSQRTIDDYRTQALALLTAPEAMRM